MKCIKLKTYTCTMRSYSKSMEIVEARRSYGHYRALSLSHISNISYLKVHGRGIVSLV